MPAMRGLVAGLCFGLMVAGCKDKPKQASAPAPSGETPTAAHDARPPSDASLEELRAQDAKSERRDVLVEDAEALVKSWVKTQNDGDFDAYLGHYQPKSFHGIRRTSSGKPKKLDFAGWRADRKRMFDAGKMEVRASGLKVATWIDPGSKLDRFLVSISFVQSWRNAKYADHGDKILILRRVQKSPRDYKIVHEDMLTSAQGFDEYSSKAPAGVPSGVWYTLSRTGPVESHAPTLAKMTDAQLVGIAASSECGIAALAADELAKRGKQPELQPSTDPDETARALCVAINQQSPKSPYFSSFVASGGLSYRNEDCGEVDEQTLKRDESDNGEPSHFAAQQLGDCKPSKDGHYQCWGTNNYSETCELELTKETIDGRTAMYVSAVSCDAAVCD